MRKLTPADKQQLIDEYADLHFKMASWKPTANPHAARFRELETEILSWYADSPAKEPAMAEGKIHVIPVSPCRLVRTILSLPKLMKRLGQAKFFAAATLPLGVIDAEIPDAKERAKFVSEEHSGKRTLGTPAVKLVRAA